MCVGLVVRTHRNGAFPVFEVSPVNRLIQAGREKSLS